MNLLPLPILLSLLILFPSFSLAEEENEDLAEFLVKLTEIGSDRWELHYTEDNLLYLRSTSEALVKYPRNNGSAYSGLETPLLIVLQVVNKISAIEQEARKDKLEKLRALGAHIEQRNGKGGYTSYQPKNKKERQQVTEIRQAEKAVEDIPEYAYNKLFLSVKYDAMSFFVPNEANDQALQYKADIDEFYGLMEPLELD